jgi:hypothetical protein
MMEPPMVEMHTVTMVMHIPKALVLQLVVALMEIQLTVVLAVTADKAAAATPNKYTALK